MQALNNRDNQLKLLLALFEEIEDRGELESIGTSLLTLIPLPGFAHEIATALTALLRKNSLEKCVLLLNSVNSVRYVSLAEKNQLLAAVLRDLHDPIDPLDDVEMK